MTDIITSLDPNHDDINTRKESNEEELFEITIKNDDEFIQELETKGYIHQIPFRHKMKH